MLLKHTEIKQFYNNHTYQISVSYCLKTAYLMRMSDMCDYFNNVLLLYVSSTLV